MAQDKKPKMSEGETVKKLYEKERVKLEEMELWKISEKVRLCIIKTPIFKKLYDKITELPPSYDIDGLMALYQKALPNIEEAEKAKMEKWNKTSPEDKAKYQYQKMLVECLKEYLKENYQVSPIRDFKGELRFIDIN